MTTPGVDLLYEKIKKEASGGGYFLNPDVEFTKDLVQSLLTNTTRYGYPACPCRLSSGIRQKDLDLICPCDYRDADVAEFNACYCALYVSKKAAAGEVTIKSIKERRPTKQERLKMQENKDKEQKPAISNLPLPVYRCKVCGYLCARPEPPDVCPICKVTRDRFERFI